MALNWVEHCPENRKASLHELLKFGYVHLSLVKQHYLHYQNVEKWHH